MSNSDIKHKLRVFISSKCDGKYAIARKALEKLLNTTGLIEVYVFETEPGSSEDTQSAYLENVDQSNLCVFLIDNADGATPAVLSEEKRAKDKQLRLLYIFCDENKKEPTPMQEEIRESLSQKYVVVHEFSDMVSVAYDSVMQDVIAVYKRKDKNSNNDHREKDAESNSKQLSAELSAGQIEKLPEFPQAFRTITSDLIPEFPKRKNTDVTPLDSQLAEQLKVVTFLRKPEEGIIDNICTEVLKTRDKEVHEMLRCRFEAQKNYYCVRYDDCITELQHAIKIALSTPSIPAWIANDIAIDIRHVYMIIDEHSNRFTLKNPGQEYIDASDEPVYYPYLDRQAENMQEEIANRYYTQLTISPYTVQFGGMEKMFTALTNTFCIAQMHGSIVQAEIVRDRLIAVYSMLCTLFSDHDLAVEYVRLLVINRKRKQLDTILRANNQTIDILNRNDVNTILNSIENISDPIYKEMSKFLLISRLGYYMDDASYTQLYTELVEYAMAWASDDSRIFNLNTYIFDFFRENTFRARGEDIVDFICTIFQRGLLSFYSNCFKVLRNIDFSKIAKERQDKIKQVFIEVISSKEEHLIDQFFSGAIIRFCKSATISITELEEKIKQELTIFYNSTFSLEMAAWRGESMLEFIEEELKEARERNATQGKNGVYSGYAYDNFDVIYNIIFHNKPALCTEFRTEIVKVIIETLASQNQGSSIKLSAMKLLQMLYFRYKQDDMWENISEKLKDNIESFSAGNKITIMSQDTNFALRFQYELFLSDFDESFFESVIEKLFLLDANSSAEIIEVLEIIATHLEVTKDEPHHSNILLAFLYFSISMSMHKENSIRNRAVRCLIELTNFDVSKKLSLMNLAKIMDTGAQSVKISIITRIKKIKADDSYLKQIINKGKADNNFLVRYVAERDSTVF